MVIIFQIKKGVSLRVFLHKYYTTKKNLPICYRKKNIYQYTTFVRIRSWRERLLKSFLPRTTLEVVHAKNDFHCTYPDALQLRNITSSNSKIRPSCLFNLRTVQSIIEPQTISLYLCSLIRIEHIKHISSFNFLHFHYYLQKN